MNAKLHTLSFIIVLALLTTSINSNAQVTIGSNITPNNGALLDLKEEYTSGGEANSKRGLGLPRVKITEKYSLKDVIEGYESLADKDKKDLSASHIGLVVYNMNPFRPDQCSIAQSGVMVWTGDDGWQNILNYQGEYQGDIATRRADSLILVKFYDVCGGDNWVEKNRRNWKSEKPLHEWTGVSVETNADGTPKLCGRVTQLRQVSAARNGSTIPNDIFNLSELRELRIGSTEKDNGYVDITDVHKLKKLEDFMVRNINITSGIPNSIGELTNLKNLDISACKGLEDSHIPASLTSMTSLEVVELYRNGLAGSIPDDIGNLVNLKTLDLANNKLTGSIPSSIGKLVKLSRIEMTSNQLSGEIPAEIGNMTSLTGIALSNNNFTSISPQLGINAATNAPNIVDFLAADCKITNLPKELALMSQLESIILNNNEINQNIPVEIAQMDKLEHLYLDHNKIPGPIPAEFGSSPSMFHLNLSFNQLTGGIPEELGNSRSIVILNLESNMNLGGQLPASLANMGKIETLNVGQCGLTGTIPEAYANLSATLRVFHANRNKLEGTLPTFFTSFPKLDELTLYENNYTGEIPASYNNFVRINTSLFTLQIQNNYLSGGDVPANIISAVNRQPSISVATEENPIRVQICPQSYTAGTGTGGSNTKPFNNFDACMPKP